MYSYVRCTDKSHELGENSHWREAYECKHCGKCSAMTGTLKIHLRTHTDEKPLECKHCDKSCGTSGSLKIDTKVNTATNVSLRQIHYDFIREAFITSVLLHRNRTF